MKIFNIDNGWTIKLPENWKEERDEIDGYHIYYPTDSDLTIRISTFHFFRNIENGWKILASVDDLSEIFNKSIKKIEVRNNTKVEGKKLNLNEFKIEENKLIDCLIIYPSLKENKELNFKKLDTIKGYAKIYKQGISIPLITNL